MNFNFEEYVKERDELATEYYNIDEILCNKTKEERIFPVSTYIGKYSTTKLRLSKSFLIISR
jgi:hypothetical protein